MERPKILMKHKILIILYVSKINNKNGSIEHLKKYMDNPDASISRFLYFMRKRSLVKFIKMDSIVLTYKGSHNAEYMWNNPEKFNLQDLKQKLFNQAIIDGVPGDLL